MKFNINRIITKVQIPIIRICNQRCPNCCARHELTWYNKNLNNPPPTLICNLDKIIRFLLKTTIIPPGVI